MKRRVFLYSLGFLILILPWFYVFSQGRISDQSIDEKVIAAIEENIPLAPLHNPPNLVGIEVAREIFPDSPQVAVFDTAFHQTIPTASFLYAIPFELYENHRIRRYGFHGTSHVYVAEKAAAYKGVPWMN